MDYLSSTSNMSPLGSAPKFYPSNLGGNNQQNEEEELLLVISAATALTDISCSSAPRKSPAIPHKKTKEEQPPPRGVVVQHKNIQPVYSQRPQLCRGPVIKMMKKVSSVGVPFPHARCPCTSSSCSCRRSSYYYYETVAGDPPLPNYSTISGLKAFHTSNPCSRNPPSSSSSGDHNYLHSARSSGELKVSTSQKEHTLPQNKQEENTMVVQFPVKVSSFLSLVPSQVNVYFESSPLSCSSHNAAYADFVIGVS
jgi:hypothetical protein